MHEPDIRRALTAAMSIGSELGLTVDDATVVHNSNKLAVRLLPCDAFARVAHAGQEVAAFEVALARCLADTGSPIAALDPRVQARPYEQDGFLVTLWTYYEPVTTGPISPSDYAQALERLHAAMRVVDMASPHFTDRVDEAMRAVTTYDDMPALGDGDRQLLSQTLETLRRAVVDRGTAEHLLHGEPHPGNVLGTNDGLVFIDLETCCRGPIEFDLAH